MQTVGKRFALVLVLVMAVAIPLGLIGPTKPDTKGYNSAVDSALSDARSNESTATGAPQQQVVNGWLTRDLLEIQIKQTNDMLVLLHLVAAILIGIAIAAAVALAWGRAGGGGEEKPATLLPASDLG